MAIYNVAVSSVSCECLCVCVCLSTPMEKTLKHIVSLHFLALHYLNFCKYCIEERTWKNWADAGRSLSVYRYLSPCPTVCPSKGCRRGCRTPYLHNADCCIHWCTCHLASRDKCLWASGLLQKFIKFSPAVRPCLPLSGPPCVLKQHCLIFSSFCSRILWNCHQTTQISSVFSSVWAAMLRETFKPFEVVSTSSQARKHIFSQWPPENNMFAGQGEAPCKRTNCLTPCSLIAQLCILFLPWWWYSFWVGRFVFISWENKAHVHN